MEPGLDQLILAAIGQPSFAHHSANKPKTALLGRSGHPYEGLIGAAMDLYAVPLLPNDHPSLAQGSLGTIGGDPKIAIFEPTHDGLKAAKSSLRGLHMTGDWGSPEMEPRSPQN